MGQASGFVVAIVDDDPRVLTPSFRKPFDGQELLTAVNGALQAPGPEGQ